MKAKDLIPGRYYHCGTGMPLQFLRITRVPARGYRSKGTVMRAVFQSPSGSEYRTTLGQVSENFDQEEAARRFQARAKLFQDRAAAEERVNALSAEAFTAERAERVRAVEKLEEEMRDLRVRLNSAEERLRPYELRYHRTEEAQQRRREIEEARAAREMEASMPDSSPTGDPIV